MARTGRELAIAQSPQLAAQGLLGDGDPELLPDPCDQIDQAPAHHAVDRRNGPLLDNGLQGRPLGLVQDRSSARGLAVDQLGRTPMRATLRRVRDVLRRHQPIPVQGRWLTQVVRGYFAYHAVPTNRRALMAFRHYVTDLWRRTLRRRSQKDRLTWARMAKVADAWLPRPHLLRPWPRERFAVKHPRWEPSARIGLARIWAGGTQ